MCVYACACAYATSAQTSAPKSGYQAYDVAVDNQRYVAALVYKAKSYLDAYAQVYLPNGTQIAERSVSNNGVFEIEISDTLQRVWVSGASS